MAQQKSRAYKIFVLLGILSICGLVLLSGFISFTGTSAKPDNSPSIQVTPVLQENQMCFPLPPLAVAHCNGTELFYSFDQQVICATPGNRKLSRIPDKMTVHFNATDTWGPDVIVYAADGSQWTFQPAYHSDNSKVNCTKPILNTTDQNVNTFLTNATGETAIDRPTLDSIWHNISVANITANLTYPYDTLQ